MKQINQVRFAWLVGITLIMLSSLLASYSIVAQDTIQLSVPTDFPTIASALESAPDHAEIVIDDGVYHETLLIERPVTLRAMNDAQVVLIGIGERPAIQIQNTDYVSIIGLQIVGGQYGVDVFLSRDVTIQNNTITESRSAGIRARMSSVSVLDNIVTDSQSPYGRGVYIANTMEWAESEIIGNTISHHPQSGIQTNMVGMVTIENNTVMHNGNRGIAVTEMSHADVFNNIVEDNIGTGIHVMDMSMARVCENTVTNTLLDNLPMSIRYGNGITIDYHSEVTLANNAIFDSPQHGISVLYDSIIHAYENTVEKSGTEAVFVDESLHFNGTGC